MMRYAPLAVERLVAAVFVLPAYAAKPTRRERVSRRGPSGAGARVARALTQERAQRTVRRLPAGRSAAASRRPEERLPSCAHPRRLPGHGKPSTAEAPAAHSPASDRRPPAGRSAHDLSVDVTERRTTRTLASPWVGASSAGGS